MNRYLTLILLIATSTSFSFGQKAKPLKPVVQTQIESVKLQVQNDGENAYFLFVDSVVLTATNMKLQCDKLEVFATRQAENDEQIGKFGAIKEIIATGNVIIEQEERTATCDKAVVKPNEERIVLTGSPVIEQVGGRMITTGPDDEIILDRGNGRITVDSKGEKRLRLTGPAITDLGFEHDIPVPTPPVVEENVEEDPNAEETAAPVGDEEEKEDSSEGTEQ